MSNLSLGKKATSDKVTRWVEPSFDGLFGGNAPRGRGIKASFSTTELCVNKQLRKRKGEAYGSSLHAPSFSVEPQQTEQDVPWVDSHAPQSQAELAVHKKKIEEVENWLGCHTNTKTSKGGAILLLTGPSGCGKSATVQVLAQDQGFRLQEWTNPSSFTEYTLDRDAYRTTFEPGSSFNGFYGSSQTGLFKEFLLRANKYSCLQMAGEGEANDRKIILVEDFPNQFYRQPGSMHDILRCFMRSGRCPLVFIVSDSLSGDSSSRLLFPRDVQEELGIFHISFNPVAPTTMTKVLNRIAALEAGKSGGRVCVPDKAVIEELCMGSSGDVRSAINSLQFTALAGVAVDKKLRAVRKGRDVPSVGKAKGARGRRHAKAAKEQVTEQVTEQSIGGKDASLFLFRALGKILHCKRESPEETEDSPQLNLPAHLSEHHRPRLLVNPELVVERSHMSGDFFNLYLHQNYMDFFSVVEDVVRASEYLSDADFLTGEWTSRSTMMEYGTSVATRGLLHSNSSQVSVGFRPLHKPNWLLVNKKHRENCLAAQCLFTNFCATPVNLQTELLPYLAKLTNPMRNQAQIAFIQDVGHLPLRRFPGRLRLEALTDKDPGMLDLDSEEEEEPSAGSPPGETVARVGPTESPPPSQGTRDLPVSQPQPASNEALMEEEDLLIEEYDSD